MSNPELEHKSTDPSIGRVSFLPSHTGDGYSYGGGIIVTIDETSFLVATIDPMKGYLEKDLKLARALAAVPEMLEALREVVATFSGYQGMQLTKARLALAKVDGNQS